jgi:hypothetical protein
MGHILGGGGSAPAPPPPLPPPPPPPSPGAAAGINAGADAANRLRERAGAASTIMTGPQGLTTPATTAPKSLLGQ